MKKLTCLLTLLAALVLGGCGAVPSDGPPVPDRRDIAKLTQGIMALGPDVDPEEAARAAHIAYTYSRQLALQYQITDIPYIHNIKVNNGSRPRGLCWHWAEDIEARLVQENFRTLDMHRAIANSENPFVLEHSTAIISRRGATMSQGLVLDPWRKGGKLFWTPTLADPKYRWEPKAKVLAEKRRRRQRKQQTTSAG